MSNIERQELYCHNCTRYVQFDIDVSLNGNHVLLCPNCKHEHCRVVVDGIITGERWSSRNNAPTFTITITRATATTSYTSQYDRMVTAGSTVGTATGSTYLASLWLSSTAYK